MVGLTAELLGLTSVSMVTMGCASYRILELFQVSIFRLIGIEMQDENAQDT